MLPALDRPDHPYEPSPAIMSSPADRKRIFGGASKVISCSDASSSA